MRRLLICLMLVFSSLQISAAKAQNWTGCSSDLDDLRRRAADASSLARETGEKFDRLKYAEEELRSCVQFPQIHDQLKDGCNYKRSDYDNARSQYQSQLQSLKSGLNDIDSKVRNSNSSCNADLAGVTGVVVLPIIPAGVQNRELCAVVLRNRANLPVATSIDICTKFMSRDQCSKCLSTQ
jgi:hypothetical protein